MKIICLTVGKKHDVTLAPAIEKYQTRLSPYVDFSFDYIPPSDMSSESDKIMKRLQPDDIVLLLDETGMTVSNSALAGMLDDYRGDAVKRLVVIIGGAYGVEDSVKNRANQVISLSKLVFPHQLVRLIIVEQLYRSFNLLAGGKYHHE